MSTSMQHTEAVMQGLASGVDSILNGDMMDPLNTGRKYGFVLLVAEFGDIAEGRVNYVSNGDKATMVAMLKEYLARLEGLDRREADERQRNALALALDALVDAKKDWWREAAPQWNMADFLEWATGRKMTVAISAIRAATPTRADIRTGGGPDGGL